MKKEYASPEMYGLTYGEKLIRFEEEVKPVLDNIPNPRRRDAVKMLVDNVRTIVTAQDPETKRRARRNRSSIYREFMFEPESDLGQAGTAVIMTAEKYFPVY